MGRKRGVGAEREGATEENDVGENAVELPRREAGEGDEKGPGGDEGGRGEKRMNGEVAKGANNRGRANKPMDPKPCRDSDCLKIKSASNYDRVLDHSNRDGHPRVQRGRRRAESEDLVGKISSRWRFT